MPDKLNPETRERIEDLCRKIFVAHTLDAEIQEELRGHIEDQLFAYLNGDQNLSEDEAFVLVREQFGDPAKLKSLLQDVHSVEVHVSLARRLAAIVAVHMMFMTATAVILTVSWSMLLWLLFSNRQPPFDFSTYTVVSAFVIPVETLLFWRILLHWERRTRAGESLWFHRWSGLSIAVLLAGLACLHSIIPIPDGVYDRAMMPLPAPMMVNVVGIVIVILSVVLHAVIWLWWCDRPPRRTRTVTYAAIAWLVVSGLPVQTSKFLRLEVYAYEPGTNFVNSSDRIVLWEDPLEDFTAVWALRTGFTTGCPPVQDLVLSLFACISLVALAKFVHVRINGRGPPADSNSSEAVA